MWRVLFIVILTLVTSSCEKEETIRIVREDLIGVWANQSSEEDFLEFDEWICLIARETLPGEWGSSIIMYSYEIWNDTLELRDNKDETHVLYKCKLEFLDSDMQVLNIKGLDTVPPYIEGEDFRRLE